MKREKIIYGGLELDSKEELEFFYWLEEARESGYILSFTYHPDPLILITPATYMQEKQLKTKAVLQRRTLLRGHTYQADWIIIPSVKFSELDHGLLFFENQDNRIWVDNKGTYNQRNWLRIFSLDQKLTYEKHKIYINLVVPEKFFARTWVPAKCAYAQNRKVLTRRKAYENCKLLSQIKERNVAV